MFHLIPDGIQCDFDQMWDVMDENLTDSKGHQFGNFQSTWQPMLSVAKGALISGPDITLLNRCSSSRRERRADCSRRRCGEANAPLSS